MKPGTAIEAHDLGKYYRLGETQQYFSIRDNVSQFFSNMQILIGSLGFRIFVPLNRPAESAKTERKYFCRKAAPSETRRDLLTQELGRRARYDHLGGLRIH